MCDVIDGEKGEETKIFCIFDTGNIRLILVGYMTSNWILDTATVTVYLKSLLTSQTGFVY